MKKVLIAIDYNPTSETVINAGYELAKLMQAQVCLIHVISDVSYYGMQYPAFMGYDSFSIPVNYEIQENIVKVANDFVEIAAKHLNDTSVMTHVAEGETSQAVLEYAKEWKADVLVMGTHSHSTLEKIFMGTVASSVMERTEIPVYMVPIKK